MGRTRKAFGGRERQRSVGLGVLGGLSLCVGGQDFTPTAPKVRQVLALLLLNVNSPVSYSVFIEELWADRPPRTAVTTIQTYVLHVRKVLQGLPVAEGDRPRLDTAPSGYVLRTDPDQLDLHVFEGLAASGRLSRSAGRLEEAYGCFRAALGLWTGQALVDVKGGRCVNSHVLHLEEKRLAVFRQMIETIFALGRHQEAIAPLTRMVDQYPFNEELHGQLMIALTHCGRRRDALAVFTRLRHAFAKEIGLEHPERSQKIHGERFDGPSDRFHALGDRESLPRSCRSCRSPGKAPDQGS